MKWQLSVDAGPTSAPVLGARVNATGVRFGLFADEAGQCAVRLFGADRPSPVDRPLAPRGDGYFEAEVSGVPDGTLYNFVVDGRELPDPYARFLPQGVHGPAMAVADRFEWRHGAGISRPLSEHVLYEVHVGTFTEQGTYEGVRAHLADLAAVGITAIELMPLGAFPGQRGWGYDGVALYAPFAPYGTPDQLRALVDEAHGHGLAVFLDVVYNHFGPAGNYLRAYSPSYFTNEHRNAWGDALNYAHPVVRRMVLENARYWLSEFRFDGLRLDATHAIIDPSTPHILRDLSDAVAALRPAKLLVAEDERNDPGLITTCRLDGIWADDFHHQLRVALTGDQDGYYAAYTPGLPGVERLAATITQGWLYQGELYPPTAERRGRAAPALDASAFVYALQNHDQVGNRALGERLNALITPDQYRAASTLLLFLPMTPLLFMGQEWAASSPFLFFTDHDPELGRLVSEGRRAEFKGFKAFSDPAARADIPDPQDPSTFERSRLNWSERHEGEHARVLALHRRLLQLRREDPVLRVGSRTGLTARAFGAALVVQREAPAGNRTLLMNFGASDIPMKELPIERRRARVGARVIVRSDLVGGASPPESLPAHTALVLAVDLAAEAPG